MTKLEWIEKIRIAQAMANSWDACQLVVSHAKRMGELHIVREIALEWYEAGARAGEYEAWSLLRNYALMAQDTEMLERFGTAEENVALDTVESKEAEAWLREVANDEHLRLEAASRVRYIYRG